MDRAAIEALVLAAADGDQDAFDALVGRFSGLVWSVVRSHRLADADAHDAFQTTWLRLVEHLDRIREPRAIGGWLATTARHESLRVLRLADRTRPAEPDTFDDVDDRLEGPDAALLRAEEERGVWTALAELGDRCQALLRVLVADPAPSYEEIGAALDMPVGSIGPTRRRCLERLRDVIEDRGITAAARHSG
jgi:RNA polymerase sigma factor (sigma-70 family)